MPQPKVVKSIGENAGGNDAMKLRTQMISLVEAARANKVKEFKSVLDADAELGGSLSELRVNDITMAHYAAQEGSLDVLRLIHTTCKNAAKWVSKKDKSTTLMLAARGGFAKVVEFLLAEGADVNAKTSSNATALHMATQQDTNGAARCVELLCEAQADTEVETESGTPLFWAAGSGNSRPLSALLAAGANANAKNEHGLTPLIMSAASCREACVLALCQYNGGTKGAKVDVDITLPGGLTPLHMCAEMGQTKAVEGMLAFVAEGAGAAATAAAVAETEAATTSLRRWTREEVKARLERRSDDGYRAVDLAALEKHRTTLELILTKMLEAGAELADDDKADALLAKWAKGPITKVDGLDDGGGDATKMAPKEKKGAKKETEEIVCEVHGLPCYDEAWFVKNTQNNSEDDVERRKARAKEAEEKKQSGNRLMSAGDHARCLERYSEAIALDGSKKAFWSNRSAVLLKLGRPKEALRDAIVARRLDDKWSKACYREGQALMALGEYLDASCAFYQGALLDPKNDHMERLFKKAVKMGKAKHQREERS